MNFPKKTILRKERATTDKCLMKSRSINTIQLQLIVKNARAFTIVRSSTIVFIFCVLSYCYGLRHVKLFIKRI